MMGEAAPEVGVTTVVLAASSDEPAVLTCDEFLVGSPDDRDAIERLIKATDVVTFDHELVDLELLSFLEHQGAVLRPSVDALRFAVDKSYQRQRFADAGIPVPRFLVVHSREDSSLADFLNSLDTEPVLKASSGGYDGRGVLFPQSRVETLATIDELGRRGAVLVEERLDLESEVSRLVVRGVDGALALYPLVTTVQSDAMCVEVIFPAEVTEDIERASDELTTRIAKLIQGVGVLAVEYFVTRAGLVVNEVALRPHNSGHWTIEGAAASQFENHLLAVSNQPLAATTPKFAHAVMVNVVGADEPGSLQAAREQADVFVHDYAKSWRPNRKLGHVTSVGDDAHVAHVRAWRGARAYGTKTKEAQ